MMFTAGEVVRISGLTYRQLDHALRSGVMKPSGGGGNGRGSPRRFSMRDLLALRVVWEVLRSGVLIRTVVPALRFIQRGRGLPSLENLGEAAVWTDGREVVFLIGESRHDARPSASAVTHLIDLSSAAKHVRGWLEKNTKTSR
jgi:hypothetical protein